MILTLAAAFAAAQYNQVTSYINSDDFEEPATAWFYTSPASATVTFYSESDCWQTIGNTSEPCPWTFPFQTLYSNDWNFPLSDVGTIPSGYKGRFTNHVDTQEGLEKYLRVSDNAPFERSIFNKVYEDRGMRLELQEL